MAQTEQALTGDILDHFMPLVFVLEKREGSLAAWVSRAQRCMN